MIISRGALGRFSFPPDSLSDGIYSVQHPLVSGGQAFFTVKHGYLQTYARTLQDRMHFWLQIAVRIGDC